MKKRNIKTNRSELKILILAISLIIILFLVFSFNQNAFYKEDIQKSSEGNQEHSAGKQSIEGTLEVIVVDDFENKKTEYFYYLKTDDGTIYALKDIGKVSTLGITSGSRIRLEGIIDQNIRSIENPEIIQIIQLREEEYILGEQKVAVILVNFQYNDTPITINEARGIFFENYDSVDAYYNEVSYNKAFVTGDVYGWYTLALDPQRCNFRQIVDATVRISDPDIYFPNYDIVSIQVAGAGCIALGTGTIGMEEDYPTEDGNVSLAFNTFSFAGARNQNWIRGVNIHEMGHNFFSLHANLWECDADIDLIYGVCDALEYADPFDPMGSLTLDAEDNMVTSHMHAMRKELFGWFDPGNVVEVSRSGDYIIEPLASVSSGIKTLKVINSNR